MYDKLVAKINNIDTSGFVLKTKYDTDELDLENKINDADKKFPDTSGLVKKTDYNAKTTETEGKIPSISGLATTTALIAVENKIRDVSSLVKKTDYNTKINEIEKKLTDHGHDKYITTPEFNQFTAENFAARLPEANRSTKSDIANFVEKTNFDDKLKNLTKKVTSNKAKHLLVNNELKILQTSDSSFFIGQNYFNNDGLQFFVIFQPTIKTIAILFGSLDRMGI